MIYYFLKTLCIHEQTRICLSLLKICYLRKISRKLFKKLQIVLNILLITEGIFGEQDRELCLNTKRGTERFL